MTLLESAVALVLVGLAGVGFLESFQRSSVAARDAAAWARATALAEAGMEGALVAPTEAQAVTTTAGMVRRVTVRPHGERLREVVVTVELPPPGASRLELRRLVRTW